MHGICCLCNTETTLKKSHVLPRFVHKWQKESSGTGHLRSSLNPNKRVQDGYKFYWLCGDCEARLNVWESAFAKLIFHPINQGTEQRVKYETWLLKFCVSVSWRVLHFHLFPEDTNTNLFPKSKSLQGSAIRTYEVWKEFLLDQRDNPKPHEQHFLCLDTIERCTDKDMPPNINRYILRTVEFDAACNNNSAFIYSKLCRFIIFGFIEMPYPEQWQGTKVDIRHGVIGPKNYTLPIQVYDYLKERARKSARLRSNISQAQERKIGNNYRKNIDRAIKSESFSAMNHDHRLFGDEVFKKKPE